MKKQFFIIMLFLMLTTMAFTLGNPSTMYLESGNSFSDRNPVQFDNVHYAEPSATPPVECPSDSEGALSREYYAPLDVAKEWERINEIDELNIEYWTSSDQSNPLADLRESSVFDVALHFAGYPNTDGTLPDRVTVVYIDSKQAIVTVLSEGMLDDSILDQEYRIELSEVDNSWMINYAGVRYRCARSGSFDWTTSLCP